MRLLGPSGYRFCLSQSLRCLGLELVVVVDVAQRCAGRAEKRIGPLSYLF